MNALSSTLESSGVGKGDRVGIFLNRCLHSPLAVYGVLNAGAVFVPLDPKLPKARLDHIIEDCNIDAIITNPLFEDKVQSLSSVRTIIGLDNPEITNSISWKDALTDHDHQQSSRKILGSDLAYIMYTSGTTGNPKGIMHTHNSCLAYARNSAKLFNIQPDDNLAVHSPLHFDISTMGYFTMPYVAACSTIIPEASINFPVNIIRLLEKEKITIWYSVPLALTQLLNTNTLDEINPGYLRWVLFGGEPFAPATVQNLQAILRNATFVNIYGPAEVNQCTFHFLPRVLEDETPIPLGFVWDDTSHLILDDENQPVKINVPGNLCIRSSTMMHGYWNQPELTSKVLFYHVENGLEYPYFKTGDLVSTDESGILHFHGRMDRQIKLRGYRIELNEIENALTSLRQVKEAAVFKNNETEIHAAIVSSEDLNIESIQNDLHQLLPNYSIPQAIFKISEIPRTSAGKVDYKMLQANYSSPSKYQKV